MTPPNRTLALLAFVLLSGLLSAACGRLPSGAPVSEDILKNADAATPEFAIYAVNRAFLPTVALWPATGRQERLGWIGHSRGPKTQIIQPGDTLSLRIWDSSDNSLLTSAEQKVAQLSDLKVSANGSVFMPYVGNISVIGLTPDLARESMQDSLEIIVPSAQVQLSMTQGRSNSVDLVSGVPSPGAYPLPDRNFTVLSLLAAGGGVNANLNNPQIRLVRGGAIYGTSVDRLLDHPNLDTLLRGGDQVFVEEDARYFLSFGAAGTEDLHIFAKDSMSAMDAVAIMGGINDNKADPKGLLILREYAPSDLRTGVRGPRQTRVVFTVDLTSTDGLFSARKFQINPDDLVVVTESPVNDVVTVSSIIGNLFGLFSRAGVI